MRTDLPGPLPGGSADHGFLHRPATTLFAAILAMTLLGFAPANGKEPRFNSCLRIDDVYICDSARSVAPAPAVRPEERCIAPPVMQCSKRKNGDQRQHLLAQYTPPQRQREEAKVQQTAFRQAQLTREWPVKTSSLSRLLMVSTAFLAGCQNDTQRHEDNAQEIVVPENETAGPIGGDTLVTVRYRCDDKKSVTARYINSQ